MFQTFPNETLYGFPVPSSFGIEETWHRLNSEAVRPRRGPLALYIHIPFCSSICHFCGFTRTDQFDRDVIADHTKMAIRELSIIANHFELTGRRLDSIFFGGGTASLLPLGQVKELLCAATDLFRIDTATELTFEGEALSLRRASYIEHLADFGFQRLSFGVQTTEPGMRSVLNLKPRMTDLIKVVDSARAHFQEVCVDFIYGWPEQSEELLKKDVKVLLSHLAVDSLDVFRFEKLDANPYFMRQLYAAGARDLRTTENQNLRRVLVDQLADAGFNEVSSTYFTRKSDPIAPIGYSTCYYGLDEGGVIGIGRGAQSFLHGKMWGNALNHEDWRQRIAEGFIPTISFGEYAPGEREAVNWPRRGYLPADHIFIATNANYKAKLEHLEDGSLIVKEGARYVLTPEGHDWIPSILEYLMSNEQRTHYHREMDRFSTLLAD